MKLRWTGFQFFKPRVHLCALDEECKLYGSANDINVSFMIRIPFCWWEDPFEDAEEVEVTVKEE